jgi:hypothetical protein
MAELRLRLRCPNTMTRYRWRIGLPLGHFVVDCIILMALFAWWQGTHTRAGMGLQAERPAIVAVQDDGTQFDPAIYPRQIGLIESGTPPAGIIATRFRSDSFWLCRDHPLDLVWFALHSVLAIAFWFAIGWRIESGHRILGHVMLAYLAARAVFAVTGVYHAGSAVQVLFWFGLLLALFFRALTWTATRAVRLSRRA